MRPERAVWWKKWSLQIFIVLYLYEFAKRKVCSETTLTGGSRFHISPPRSFGPGSLVTGSKRVVRWTSETWWEWSEIAISPQGSPQQLTPSVVKPEGDLQQAWNWDRRAVWDQVGLSHCQHEGLVMVRNEVHLRRGHRNDQSRWGHQCSETTLMGESRFHISPPRIFEPGSLVTGSKWVVHWTSETCWEWSEIAGFPQVTDYLNMLDAVFEILQNWLYLLSTTVCCVFLFQWYSI